MNFFRLSKRRSSAPVARERLQILLEYERSRINQTDIVAVLRDAILEAVCRHVAVDRDNVHVKLDRGDGVSTIAVDIEIPNAAGVLSAHPA